MADRFYNAEVGAQLAQDVNSAPTDAVEYAAFRVTYTAPGNSKEATLLILDAIRQNILQNSWPPA